MSNLRDLYEAKYGASSLIILSGHFGGDPGAIIRAQEARVGETYIDFTRIVDGKLAECKLTPEDLVDAVHYDITAAIRDAFFGGMSRQQAAAVVSTLAAFPASSMTLCDGLEFNDFTFADAWHAAHPTDRPISLIDVDQLP